MDVIQQQLDDHIVKTQGMRGSPFVRPIEAKVVEWDAKLQRIQDVVDEWLKCQVTYMYLEPIFGSEDIMRQLPAEGKKFQEIDEMWKNIMKNVSSNPNVLHVCAIPGLYDNFVQANRDLDEIQKVCCLWNHRSSRNGGKGGGGCENWNSHCALSSHERKEMVASSAESKPVLGD